MMPVIDFACCNGCGTCREICPSDVFTGDGAYVRADRPEDCIECWACVQQCPCEAIRFEP